MNQRFKIHRNMLVTLIRKSKENHFNKYFSNNIKNLRETWKGIKNIIQTKSTINSLPTYILNKDPIQIANTFNSFFSPIGENLQSKIHSSHTNFTKYLKNLNICSLFISPTDSAEVYNLISSLKKRKSFRPK